MPDEQKPDQQQMIQGLGVLIGLALLLLTCLSPGMVLITIIRTAAGLNLDAGQMWTFATLSAIGCFGVLWLVVWLVAYWFREEREKVGETVHTASYYTVLLYGVCGLLIVAVSLVLHFGFKVKAVTDALGRFFQ
jgi:hypothetical protein